MSLWAALKSLITLASTSTWDGSLPAPRQQYQRTAVTPSPTVVGPAKNVVGCGVGLATLGRRLGRRAASRTLAGSCRGRRTCARGGSGSRGWSARCRWSGRAWWRRRRRGGAGCGEQRRNGDRRNSKPGCLHRSPRGWVVDGAVDSRVSVVGNLLSGAGAGSVD